MALERPHKIESIRACISVDPKDGDEGIMGCRLPDGTWMPLIASDNVRFEFIVDMAEKIKTATGIDYKVINFSTREDVSAQYKPKPN
jgi:hypothetical protein